MSKHGKKYEQARKAHETGNVLPIDKALAKLKDLAYAKFDESVDVDVNLSIDPDKGDQVVRGSVTLPYSKGRQARVVVFAKGDYALQAEKAGADVVGSDDLVDRVLGGWTDFDFAVATPDLMGIVGKLAKILGPQGKLPNKKQGTVTFDVSQIVKELKQGRVFFKNDKQGIVHFSFGKASFDNPKLRENLVAFIKALVDAKPAASKGKYLKKMTLTTTMGVGIQVNPDELLS